MSDTIEMAPLGEEKECEQLSQDAKEPFPDLTPTVIIQREIPNTWRYKSLNMFGLFRIPYYASPEVQLVMVSIIAFLNPGSYNALSGLGGAGQLDPHIFDVAQTALYATFAVVAFNSGTVSNVLGVRWTLTLGALGYAFYAASFLSYNHTQNGGLVIFAGVFLGWSAGLFWTAQGAVMMCYPRESSKGRYIAWFWSIFNVGAVIGGIVPLSANFHTNSAKTVNDTTYIVFIVLMASGGFLALLMCNGDDVVRSDGSWVLMPKNPTWKTEVLALWDTLRTDTYVLLLFPMFFCSNFFYTYQFNGINQAHFNTRTRALNNLLYWTAQIAGAVAYGYSVDNKRFRRTIKAKVSWVMLFCLTMAVWGGGLAWQLSVPDRGNLDSEPIPVMDWTDQGYWKGMILYMAYGFFDAVWQSCVYWFLGALTNFGRKTANFAGFYKGIQSAGAAVMWRLDSLGKPFMTEFLSNWILLASALIIAFPVIFFKITDHIPEEDELEYDGNGNFHYETTDNHATGEVVSGNGRAAARIATGIHNTEVQDPRRQRLQPRDEVTLRSTSLRPLPPSTETVTDNVDEEIDPDSCSGTRGRPVSVFTLREAVAALEPMAAAYEAVHSAVPLSLHSVPQRRESNRASRTVANRRQIIYGDD